jgi:hypothetical protein
MKPCLIEKEITQLVARYKRLNAAWKPLTDAVKNHDFPAWTESYSAFDALTDAVAIRIGDPMMGTQHSSWLAWYIYDNNCGEKAMQAKAGAWKKSRPIKTASDLAALIAADSK